MGYDAPCEVRYDGQTGNGKAVLEQAMIVVRGTLRLTIPLASVTRVTAVDGWLRLRVAGTGGKEGKQGKDVALALGPQAAKWAQRILHPPSRLDKLGVKPGMRVRLLGGVDAAFADDLARAGAAVIRRGGGAPADLVFYAVERREDLTLLEALAGAIVPNGAIWTLRTKGQRAVTEADTMAAGKAAGLVDVKVVSFSETITAEKFVIPVARRPTGGRTSSRRGA